MWMKDFLFLLDDGRSTMDDFMVYRQWSIVKFKGGSNEKANSNQLYFLERRASSSAPPYSSLKSYLLHGI